MADPYAVRPYGDPNLAKGFANLAQMFVPPSTQDRYAAARAGEVQQKMQGIAELYRMATDPNAATDPRFDMYGAITGSWSPTTGFGARNMKDATDRRGQDIHSGDVRYKVDQDNRTDLDKTRIVDQGNTTRTMLQPIQKDAVRHVPPSVADMFKVPSMQTGVVAAQPGEKNFMPDGRVLEGNVKPKTEAEVKGDIIAGLTDEERRAIGFGNTPVETIVDPATGKPKAVTRPQQLDTGTPSVVKGNGEYFNYVQPDGKSGTAIHDPITQQPVDAQSRQPLAPGSKLQAPSGVQGKDPLGPTTANSTEANRKAAMLDELQLLTNQYSTLLRNNPAIVGPVGDIRGFAQNLQATIGEVIAASGGDAPIQLSDVRALASRIAPNRDPAIQQARIMAADLAYKWAQAQNPSGEVSRQAFERALETLNGGMLRNNQSALEALDGVNQFITRQRTGVSSLRTPGSAVRPAPAGPTTINTSKGVVTIQKVE